MLAMTLLGVGTAVPDMDRENTHMVWSAPEGLLLVDAGGSTYQRLLRASFDPLTLQGVFLTHAHADHINGLPALLFQLSLAGYSGTLPIYGNAPTLALMQRVLTAFELGSHQVPVNWITVTSGQAIELPVSSYRLEVADTVHPRPCLALRFEDTASERALVYSADTEPCPPVLDLAKDATILIHEATTDTPFAGHTTPRQAGAVAVSAGVERLVLVHFSPHWTMSASQAIEEVRAAGFAGDAEIGREFGVYSL